MKMKNTSDAPQAILRECVIDPGKTATVTSGAANNPGVAARIADGRLEVVKPKETKAKAEPSL